MLGKRIINTGGVSCTTDTTQILDAGTTNSVALYRFEDNANDTASSTGKFGKGALFNGSNSTIELSGGDMGLTFGSSANYSIAFWFNTSDISTWQRVFNMCGLGGNSANQIAVSIYLSKIYIYLRTGTSTSVTQIYSSVLSSNTWYHAAFMVNGSTVTLYLDGVAHTLTTGGTTTISSVSNIIFGSHGYTPYFNGKIDQLRIFNKAISSSEVTTLYNETSSTVNTLQILGDTSCVAAYTFEGNANDLSTNYNGTASNVIYDYSGTESSITYATGKFGKAAVFDKSNSSYIYANSSVQQPTKNFSVSIWTKLDSLVGGGSSGTIGFIGNFKSGVTPQVGFVIAKAYNESAFSFWADGTANSKGGKVLGTTVIQTGVWYHVVGTYDGTNVKIYVNGILENSVAYSSTPGATDQPLVIGRFYGNYNDYYLHGKIDQVRIFDKALSPGEINSLYNETATTAALSTISNPSTIAYYKMADATDETGSYNGTASNIDFNVQGKYGFAGKFNGSSSRINTGYQIPSGLTGFSVSAWVKAASVKTQFIVGDLGTGGASADGMFQINISSSNKLRAAVGGTVSQEIATLSSYINTWTHIVVTTDSSGNIIGYVNGSQVGTASGNSLAANTKDFMIGMFGDINHSSTFNGSIDQIRIFNKAISADEVTTLYNEIQCANTIATPESYFDTTLYVGNNTNRDITGIGFKPGFVWIKNRDAGYNHALYDSVRGPGTSSVSNQLSSNTDNTTAWHSPNYGYLSAFLDNGFSLTNGSTNGAAVNTDTNKTVAWAWKAGSSNVTNNDGTITSTVSASPESGFSIVTYSPNNTVGMSIGHGLSKAPSLVITKRLDATQDWGVYTNASTGDTTTNWLSLNDADAYGSGNYMTLKSTTLELPATGAFWASNSSNQVAYCFANIDGYQRISSYVGTGTTENFIYTGFEPAWVLIKNVSTGSKNWVIADNKRDNADEWLYANDYSAAYDDANTYTRFYENGFSVAANGSFVNTSGDSYIFLAIAANPDTTAPTKANSFKTKIYTGDGGTQSITGVGFKPDLTWVKNRSTTGNHSLIDSVRGVNKPINSNTNNLEQDYPGFTLTSFLNDGFSVTDNSDGLYGWNGPAGSTYGGSTGGYVSWNWKALDHDRNLAAINTDGTIPSVVSANSAAGFSIVKYTSIANVQQFGVGHGLSSTPQIIFQKKYGPSSTSTSDWYVITNVIDGSVDYLNLNGTAAKTDMTGTFANFQLGSNTFTDWWTGADLDIINYCFHSVSSHSKIGSYEGDGSTSGTTISLDFKPSFLLVKNADDIGSWHIFDSVRNPSNPVTLFLKPNQNVAEGNSNSFNFNNNGFEPLATYVNQLNDTYIYMAFK